MRIFKRGDIWWLDYKQAGKRIRTSLETSDKANAESLMARQKLKSWALLLSSL